jgi:hypothetical protein
LNEFINGTPLSAVLQKKDSLLRELTSQKLQDALKQEFGDSLQSAMLAFGLCCTKRLASFYLKKL